MSNFSTELDIARGVAEGKLPSPAHFYNADYIALRLSGTGVAFRKQLDELVYRDPKLWLSADMQRRVLGAPVVVEHPPTSILSSNYYGATSVGTIVYSFVRNMELWGVARILDRDACALLAAGEFDTSPGVVFPPVEPRAGVYIGVGGSGRMLVEAEPCLIDHIALVWTGEGNRGVWTRSNGENGPGVDVTQNEMEGAI